MMRGITAGKSAFRAMVRVLLVVAFLAVSVAEQGSAQTQGSWYRFSTAINHNGEAFPGRPPMYFAEIKLVIPLSKEDRDSVDVLARGRQLDSLKQFLKQKLQAEDDTTARKAKEKIIDALVFRRRALEPDEVRGIDWVNIGTGTDYSGDPSRQALTAPEYFAEIHLLIPLTEDNKKTAEKHAKENKLKDLRDALKSALKEADTENIATTQLIGSLTLKKEKK